MHEIFNIQEIQSQRKVKKNISRARLYHPLPRLLIIATKMKMEDETAPKPIMAKATILLFSNISMLYSYSPLEIVLAGVAIAPHLSFPSSVSQVIFVHKTVEKKKRLLTVMKKQAQSPQVRSQPGEYERINLQCANPMKF